MFLRILFKFRGNEQFVHVPKERGRINFRNSDKIKTRLSKPMISMGLSDYSAETLENLGVEFALKMMEFPSINIRLSSAKIEITMRIAVGKVAGFTFFPGI